jgi:hypothetical protein
MTTAKTTVARVFRMGLALMLAPFVQAVQAQDSQFVFDATGNLIVQTANVGAPPQILGQPQNQVVAWGQSASFSVVAADTDRLAYQWLFNGTALPGATADSLLVTDAGTADEGPYSVVLANHSGSVTSAPAMLMLDRDADGLGDGWELTYFGTLGQYPTADSDGDGVSNVTEFQDGTDPTDSASAIFRLTLLSDGGHVTVTPSRFRFTNGESVTLTATAFSPHSFHGWGGDIEETNNPIMLTMTNNKTLFAYLSSYDIQWRTGANGDWHARPNWNPRIVPASNDNVFVTGTGQITNNSDVVCRNLLLGGPGGAPILSGNGNLMVLETCDWLGGTMSGSGRTVIAPGATLTIANPTDVTLRGRTLENAGTALWTGNARIFVDGGIITNRAGALFEAQNAAFLAFNLGAAIGRFDNAGTFRKTSPGTTTFDTTTVFNNYADVEIQNGTLALRGGGRNQGAMEFWAGTTLNLAGSTFNSSAASSISGPANFVVSGSGTHTLAGLVNLGGTHTFSGATANLTGNYICTNNAVIITGGTANFSGTGLIMPATVSLSSGSTLNGSSELTVLDEFNWTGGTMSGSGRTVIAPGATFNITTASVHFLSGGRTVENGGTMRWSGGFLTMGGATITNRAGALFDNQTAVTVSSGAGNWFNNAGTFRKSVNAGTATWPVTFNNSGRVEIETGRFALDGAGTNTSMIEIAAGASLDLSSSGAGFISSAGSSISGAGNFIVSGNATLSGLVNPGGTHTFSSGGANLNGDYICTNNPATISGGIVNFNSTSAVAVVHYTGGTLSGSGVLNVLETMNWSGGFMGGSGRTVIAPGATLNLNNGAAVTLSTRTLENGGRVLWTGAGNLTASGTVITNRPGALFEVRNNAALSPQGFQAWRFDNAGTFRKTTSGTTTFAAGVSLNNYNTVEIRSGILVANGGYTSRSNSLLNCAIGGTTAGTGFGQLQVAGTVNLNGSLGVDLINGFLPATNDSFTVLTAGARSGTFANFYHPSNDVVMQLSNGPTSVIVRVTDVLTVPRPLILQPELVWPDIKITWTAISNRTYRLEFKPDLALTNWMALTGDVTASSNTASKMDALTASNRFYRVRVIP